jgi:hypothetical protein
MGRTQQEPAAMNFKIKRTSNYDAGKPPCLEAVQISTNEWEVTLHTLEDFVAFADRHGELVYSPLTKTIEIYDA